VVLISAKTVHKVRETTLERVYGKGKFLSLGWSGREKERLMVKVVMK